MAEEVLVDALPYFDSGYDEPGVRQAVSALIKFNSKKSPLMLNVIQGICID